MRNYGMSMIEELNQTSQINPEITTREDLLIDYIQKMIDKHPNLILALQECHPCTEMIKRCQ